MGAVLPQSLEKVLFVASRFTLRVAHGRPTDVLRRNLNLGSYKSPDVAAFFGK
jgi:hypothetical protein